MSLPFVLHLLGKIITYPFRPRPKEQPYSEDLAKWGDDMTYLSSFHDDKIAKKALKIAKQYGGFRNYELWYRLGNLYIIRGSTPPDPYTMDGCADCATLGVIWGDRPRFVRFPSRELFEHFMNLTRNEPDLIQTARAKDPEKEKQFALDCRIRTAILLATNDTIADRVSKNQKAPEWKDENGVLTIQYLVAEFNGSGFEYFKCMIVVDASQNYQYERTEIMDMNF